MIDTNDSCVLVNIIRLWLGIHSWGCSLMTAFSQSSLQAALSLADSIVYWHHKGLHVTDNVELNIAAWSVFALLPGPDRNSRLVIHCLLVVPPGYWVKAEIALLQMPEAQSIQVLSVSREVLTSVAFNAEGDWLALGCAGLGQLLVWEWRSETYVLRQQGHYYDVSVAAFSPDGATIATGADDAKAGP